MKLFRTILASSAAIALCALPAIARDQYVQDTASMFDPATVAQVNARIGSFNAQTGKEVVIVTVPSVPGGSMSDVRAAAEKTFAQQSVNGVLIFVDKGDRKDIIVPDRAGTQSGWFSSETLASIRQSMEAQFKQEDYNGGLTTGVGGILGVYRSHLSSLQRGGAAYTPVSQSSTSASAGGVHINMFWIIIFIVVGYFIIRSITRPRYYGPPPGTPGQPGTPAGGMPGTGAGYGGYGYGGGGSFFSGLLGGLGGAWLGNEMFNRGGGGNEAGMLGGGAPADPGGFGSDAGQADLGGSSGGDWGGGGFGGGDFGGGGGDSGGGW